MKDEQRLEAVSRVRDDLVLHAMHFAKIKDKDGKIVPFVFNLAQQMVHKRLERQLKETGKVRALILKYRQGGISTYIAERFYHKTSMRMGQTAFIVTHEDKATSNLFDMVKRMHDHNPLAPSIKASNEKALVFRALDGGYKVATAGSKDVGRSNTAQLLHGCLGAGALVMMADGGLKKIEDLKLGDMVRTRQGFAAAVKVVSSHKDETREIRIKSNSMPLRATDSHKFWTKRGMVKLSDLQAGDELGFPVREITEELTHIQFASELSVRAHGGGRKEHQAAEEISLNFDLGRLLGLYLAEGHVANQAKAPNAPSSVMFASFVQRMCGRTTGKHLPHEWWRMPKEFVRGLMVGYLAGDGSSSPTRDRRIGAPSIVPAITFGMRDVIAALGYGFPSIGFKDGAVRGGRNEKAQYTLLITGNAVDEIVPMLGWEMPERTRCSKKWVAVDGYAWLPILSIGALLPEMVWDIEVDHPDHDYCLAQCATSNSEYAFWANAQSHLAGIGSTVSDGPGTEIILESTANGIGNSFHQLWQAAEAGQGEYIAIFLPWFIQPEYRAPVKPDFQLSEVDVLYMQAHGLDMAQMQWRANKVALYGQGYEWLFNQEFPATAGEAFQTSTQNPLINPSYVMAAVNSTFKDSGAPLLIGCDPAGDGVNDADRTAIAFRRGRMVNRVEYHSGLDTMQIAGKLAQYHREMGPAAIFVDKGGLGAGVFDRLRELGVPVIGVNSATRANDPERYENKRAEMWWTMAEWFADQPNRMPNDAALISDLTAPQPKVSSNGRKLLEKKEDMAKRQVRSPDGADALALTFAEPISVNQEDAASLGRASVAPTVAGY